MKLRPNRQLNYSFKGGDPPSRIKKPSVTIPAAVDHQRTVAEDILVILPIFVQLPDFRGWARTTPIPTYPSCLRLRLQPLKEHDLRTREGSRRTEGQIVLNWLGFNWWRSVLIKFHSSLRLCLPTYFNSPFIKDWKIVRTRRSVCRLLLFTIIVRFDQWAYLFNFSVIFGAVDNHYNWWRGWRFSATRLSWRIVQIRWWVGFDFFLWR